MKILELDFVAYGPFSDKALSFRDQGLHIVHGPNEAGKSSALRGLKSLLYGIDNRNADNFLHANDRLLIRGVLEAADSSRLEFGRRKGRKNTLLTVDGKTLDEGELSPFLLGISAELFETLFGIDHQALEQGGQDILEQKGEVGKTLFSAALGNSVLRSVLEGFDHDARKLFLPRGSNQTINVALESYAGLAKEIRDRSLSSERWNNNHRALMQTTEELEKIRAELANARAELSRLQRVQRVLPMLARRRKLYQDLTPLDNTPVLSNDFSNRRTEAMRALDKASTVVSSTAPRLAELEKQQTELPTNQKLLDREESIQELHSRLGAHRKALQDQRHLKTKRQELLTDTDSILNEIRPDLDPDDVGQLQPLPGRRQHYTELGGRGAVLTNQADQAESNLRDTETRLKAARMELEGLAESPSTETLRREIAAARKRGELDNSIQAKRSELSDLQAKCAADLSQLTLWSGKLEDLLHLPVPNRQSINRFEGNYKEFNRRVDRLVERRREIAASLQAISQSLDEMRRAGSVPTEEMLADARSKRDTVWQLLLRQWVGGEDVSTEATQYRSEGALPDVYESRLAEADKVSDRLRREANRVNALASLEAKRKSEQRQASETAEQLEEENTKKFQLEAEWRKLWLPCRIVPLPPEEMRLWLDSFERLRERTEKLNGLRNAMSDLEQIRDAHVERLNLQIDGAGGGDSQCTDLEGTLLKGEALTERLEDTRRRKESCSRNVGALERELGSLSECRQLATKKLEEWNVQWNEEMRSLGLPEGTSPLAVSGFIDQVKELFDKRNEAEKLRIRINAIDDDAADFRGEVAAMVSMVVPELGKLPEEDAVVKLNSLLLENRSRQTKRQQNERQIEQAKKEIQKSNAEIKLLTGKLDELCGEANCDNHDELEAIERQWADCQGIKRDIGSIEEDILATGDGIGIEDLEAQTKGTDPDRLPALIGELTNKITESLEPKQSELAQKRGREEKELEIMDGGDHAALLADKAQATLAHIRSSAERYIHVKLAGRILRDQIERYRQENQGSLVRRTSEHFSSLTLGSFHELVTDFDAETDEPVFVGVRSGGERVFVDGLSSGTRDQLYLALRLASLEKYMESAEPMPFIVDDIIVNFDDNRTQAALSLLAELAGKTQVILFTHHSRVVEQANGLRGKVNVHELST